MATTARLTLRPAREIVGGIAIVGIGSVLVLGMLGMALANEDPERLTAWMTAAGNVALDHIGWGLGSYIATLLALFALVNGSELLGDQDPDTASGTREIFSVLAVVMCGLLAPVLLLIVGAAVRAPEKVGALLIILPTGGLVCFLAVQIGRIRFVTLQQQRDAAKQVCAQAREVLPTVRRRSRRPYGLVLAVNVVLAAGVGTLVTTLLGASTQHVAGFAAWYVLTAIGLGLVEGNRPERFASLHTPRAVMWLGRLVVGAMYLVVAASAGQLILRGHHGPGAATLAVGALCAVSAQWPRERTPAWLLDWTLHGGAAAVFARSTRRTLLRARATIHELGEH